MRIYKNMSGLEFVIIENLPNRKVIVKFLDTGSVVKADGRNVAAGKISDPYQRSRLGIGYLGDFKKTTYHKQAYQLWSNMLKRCYDPNDKRGYYGKGVIVDSRWQCFANFLDDLPKLKNFDQWVNKKGYDLDKDYIGDGKIYSRETCCFISSELNKSLGKKNKTQVNGQWVTSIV